MYTEHTFYRNPAVALQGTQPITLWKKPGNALSASAIAVYKSIKLRAKSATWRLVWTPNNATAVNHVRLVKADSGPVNEVQIAICSKQGSTPLHCLTDITAKFNEVLCDDSDPSSPIKWLIQETCGDTNSLIYGSSIDVVWEDEPPVDLAPLEARIAELEAIVACLQNPPA